MTKALGRITALLLAVLICVSILPEKASAKTVAQWLEGYDTGEKWFGDDFAYDITDEAACWELLMQPITVLDADQKEMIAPRKTPGGDKVNTDKLGGTINGASAAVHVLGEDEDGWTLIEGVDYYNRIIRGYVKTKLLKTVTPRDDIGIIIDKLTQKLYVFREGKLWSSCAISTGLPNDEQPYNETAAGEYLMVSRVGAFDSEGMICDMAMRFNGGDMIHQVPYTLLADGSKRFTKWESQLGQKASHGCVRTAKTPNDDGLAIQWLWDNVKLNTKVIVWDDYGRALPYPEDSKELYYNPEGGKYYHSTATCNSVREKYLPLAAFTYGELDSGDFAKLEPCPSCTPVKRKAFIDEQNASRGAVTPNKTEEPDATASPQPENTADPETTDEPQATDGADAASDGVTIVIRKKE
ncbi:MAG: L,D-transpeptidase [Eubacteriales bacterium]|nr:L,D-transpeptidase [Eubacteriales bacterium]